MNLQPLGSEGKSTGVSEATTRAASDVLSDGSDAPQTDLRQTLKERHVNMIGFSTVVGVGLVLSGGKAIYMAGPGGAVLAYLVTGSIMVSVMACLGEMTALFPVRGPIFEFARRFIDQSVGFAAGWLAWFSWTTVCASEILAITQLFNFRLVLNTLEMSNTLETGSNGQRYGRAEYIFGCLKMVFLVGVIMFNIVLNARERFHSSRFWTYRNPLGFSRNDFVAKSNPDGSPRVVLTGSLGGLASFWSAMIVVIFSMTGMEVILYTAAENRDLRRAESIKMATRKLSLRVILLYVLAIFTVGLNVPYNDHNLYDPSELGVRGGQNSIFIIEAIREHVVGFPHFFNGFFIFCACSCGFNCLYAASRALHALACIPDAWPSGYIFQSIRGRLERTKMGVPMNAVFVSWLVAFLAFLSVNEAQAKNLGRMVTISVCSNLLVYAINCIAYLKFYRLVNAAARGDLDVDLNLSPEMRTWYKRSARLYPYRSHLQWVRALYAFTGCTLMLIFQGWRTLIPPVSANDFVASYISIVLLLLITLAYFLKDRGFSPGNWRLNVIGLTGLEVVGPIVVSSDSITIPCKWCSARHRRGYLSFPDRGIFTKNNFLAFIEWVWRWME